jgi:selenide, water dikinase
MLVLLTMAHGLRPDARITVISDTSTFVYSGMVPGFVAGQYRMEEIGVDVVALSEAAGARFLPNAVVRIDGPGRSVQIANGTTVPFDVLSINVGSTVAGFDRPGVRDHAVSTRPIGLFAKRIAETTQNPDRFPERIVVCGGGAGGIEIAFTLFRRLHRLSGHAPALSIVHSGSEILEGSSKRLVRRIGRRARLSGMTILSGRRIVAVEKKSVLLENGECLPQDLVVWATGAEGHPFIRNSKIPIETRGFIKVRDTLQVEGYDEIFAAGDCAALTRYPRLPKAGVYSVRQAPVLAHNLSAVLEGRKLRAFKPQADFLTLLNLGDGTAAGGKWGLAFEGCWVMRLKDRIDRKFVETFVA